MTAPHRVEQVFVRLGATQEQAGDYLQQVSQGSGEIPTLHIGIAAVGIAEQWCNEGPEGTLVPTDEIEEAYRPTGINWVALPEDLPGKASYHPADKHPAGYGPRVEFSQDKHGRSLTIYGGGGTLALQTTAEIPKPLQSDPGKKHDKLVNRLASGGKFRFAETNQDALWLSTDPADHPDYYTTDRIRIAKITLF